MKREFLQNIKLGDQTLSKELIDAILDENSRDLEGIKAKFADYDTLKTQISDANAAIDGFKALDIDGIKKAADDWKLKAEKAERDADAKVAEIQFNSMLDSAVIAAKGKNAKAVKALLDVDTLKTSKNQEADIKTALEALKNDSDYLFDADGTPPPYAGGTGKDPITGKATNEMSYTELCAFMEKNPSAQI